MFNFDSFPIIQVLSFNLPSPPPHPLVLDYIILNEKFFSKQENFQGVGGFKAHPSNIMWVN